MNDRIKKTKSWVKNVSFGEGTGHDWFHVQRVFDVATNIAEVEGADLFTVQMAALLHDIDDPKLNPVKITPCGKVTNAANKTLNFMAGIGLNVLQADRIWLAISEVSFSKNKDRKPSTIEAAVVQDADRLDAIGAVGIARCFAFGGNRGRMIYNPSDLTQITTSTPPPETDQKPFPPSSLAHFYEKLLLVKDLMNTAEGRRLAEGRHKFLESYLDQFFLEWNGMR